MTVFALFFIMINTYGQTLSLGAKAGISIPNLSAGSSNTNPLNTGYSSTLGEDAALFAELRFSKLFSLQTMIEYASEGGKKNGFQALPTPADVAPLFPSGEAPAYLYANFNSKAKLDYLMIPVLAEFQLHYSDQSPWRLYADAGPFVGFLLSAKQVTSGSSPLYADAAGQQALPAGTQSFNSTGDIKSQLHNANFGIEGNLGIAYCIGKSRIFFEAGGNYGFLNIQKGTANGKNHVGETVEIIVTQVIQTERGKMIFAEVPGEPDPTVRRRVGQRRQTP